MRFTRKPAVPATLLASPLAETASHDELRQLDRIGTIVPVAAGRRIIAEGAIGRECFVVLDGELAVESTVARGTLGAGDVAGELALMTGRRRSASVEASSDAAVYAFNRREFAALFDAAPQLRARVVAAARDRLAPHGHELSDKYLDAVSEESPTVTSWADRLAGVSKWRPGG